MCKTPIFNVEKSRVDGRKNSRRRNSRLHRLSSEEKIAYLIARELPAQVVALAFAANTDFLRIRIPYLGVNINPWPITNGLMELIFPSEMNKCKLHEPLNASSLIREAAVTLTFDFSDKSGENSFWQACDNSTFRT